MAKPDMNEFPTGPEGFAALAEEHVTLFRDTQSLRDLLPAVLATTHMPEWHPEWRKTIYAHERGIDLPVLIEFKRVHAEWNIVRQIANGVKHCKLKAGQHLATLTSRRIEWEDDSFWEAADDLERSLWFVNDSGKDHVVHLLCSKALEKFRAALEGERSPA